MYCNCFAGYTIVLSCLHDPFECISLVTDNADIVGFYGYSIFTMLGTP